MKIILATALVLSSTIGFAADPVAKINDKTISVDDYKNSLKSLGPQSERIVSNPDMKKKFLDHLINSKLLSEAALKDGIEKDAAFQKKLEDVKAQLLAGEFMDRYLAKNVNDKAMEKFFKEHEKEFSKKEITASHILVKEEAKAKELLKKVQAKGVDFEKIGKENSIDKSVSLGTFGRGRMVPEFEQAAFNTAKGTIHPNIVKTQFGYHIIKVTDVKGDDTAKFADAKPEVERRLRAEMQQNLVESLRKDAKVEVNDAALQSVK
jgi:peptidyl-prolyl cis-trans isomerase C